MVGMKRDYTFFYYAMSLNTGEVKFVAHSRALTKAPQNHKKRFELRLLKDKFLNKKLSWRIIETGYCLTRELQTLKYKPLKPQRYDGHMAVFVPSWPDMPGVRTPRQ